MKTITRLLFLVAVFGALPPSSRVFGQAPQADLHAKLLLVENKSTFRIGEPIKLIIEFTADRDGYQADTIPDGREPTSDVITVSPTNGVTPWLDEYLSGYRSGRDVFGPRPISSTPLRVEFMLNDTLRFDRPGKYSVLVTTRRASRTSRSSEFGGGPIVLTTNTINFDVQPMSETEEQKEVNRLSELLAAARGREAEINLAQELAFLTGEASTREKVKRFVDPKENSGNYMSHIHYGLFIGRNRALVLQLLETAMRDPNSPVTSSLLFVVSRMRMLLDYHGAYPKAPITTDRFASNADPRQEEIEQRYIAEVAAGLGKRAGKNQTTTAMTILTKLPKDTQPANPVLTEVRSILLQQFDSLHAFDQEYLLCSYWDKIKDPSLALSLEKLLGHRGMAFKNTREAALKALMELSPEKAKQYVIAEIRDPQSLVDYQILQSLPDMLLSEVDADLAEQIRKLADSKVYLERELLKQKASLATRYASENIYPDLMEIYSTLGAKLPLESRACLLAYLVKHNEAEALPLIEQAMTEVPAGDHNFLPQLTRLYYSAAIDGVLRKRLESDEPQAVSSAAYLISLYGSAGDQKVIEARLERWLKEWRHRPAEADANSQGMAEVELIQALSGAKWWKLTPEQAQKLQQACVTKRCRQNFQLQ
jgi:hypothetical protein